LHEQIKDTVAAEFSSRQTVLLQEVKNSIISALKTDQRVVVIEDKEGKSRKWWDVLQIAVPSLLTGAFGVVILLTQSNLSTEITAVSTRYVLTQEFDKEKFKVYQRTMMRLTALSNALAGAGYGSRGRANAVDAYNSFDNEVDNSEFYFSPEVLLGLRKISSLASTTKDINPNASGKAQDVEDQIDIVKNKIRDEVHKEMGLLPEQK